eukprot:SAG11_NODE_2446_length_3350_cov_8.725008_2_plen_30_part_00
MKLYEIGLLYEYTGIYEYYRYELTGGAIR